jgi:hypothetical protein
MGTHAVPVYEIYKVGAPPHWVEGLDLLAETGLRAAVIPHYDNAEGGTHDTRYCYLGERRLRMMERDLPDEVFVLGVDEHTACILDLDVGSATVVGLGSVTVRRDGRSTALQAGSTIPVGDLVAIAGREKATDNAAGTPPPREAPHPRLTPLMQTIVTEEADFSEAMEQARVPDAVRAALDLEDALVSWSADTFQSDEPDRGRAALRRMIAGLGTLAEAGAGDPRDAIAPYVDALLTLRATAREEGRFADADAIRSRLVALGLELRDTATGTEWDPPPP